MKKLIAFLLFIFLAQESAMAVSFVRAHIFVKDGRLTAFRNRVDSPVFDKRGGWADEFSVDLRRVDNQAGWNGASWRMCRNRCWEDDITGELFDTPDVGRTERVSFEAFVDDVIQQDKHNTGAANVDVCTYTQGDDPGDDFDLNVSPLAAFNTALGDLVKKPFALERPPSGPPI